MALPIVALLTTMVALVVLQIALYRSAAPEPARVPVSGRSRGRLHQF